MKCFKIHKFESLIYLIHRTITLIASYSYPKFWDDLESDLGEHSDDLVPVKSVLTALGYSTKSSVAAIKTAKNVSNLEKDFLQLFSSKSIDETLEKFPALKSIKSFTPGMKAVIYEVVTHLNQMAKLQCFENAEAIKEKMFEQAKKVR